MMQTSFTDMVGTGVTSDHCVDYYALTDLVPIFEQVKPLSDLAALADEPDLSSNLKSTQPGSYCSVW